ncbi:MAG: hypothetical protein HYV27_14080 [Candidatus Hydrogenedentes bacterium]|nr:hypothetical protein [Candidatus Hydrogenedentota bacterium]
MKSLAPYLALLSVTLILGGCNTLASAPEFRGAKISPDQLYPGDSALITVEVKDREAIIQRIEGVVKEDPRITFKLRDDGVDPDEKAGDGIWTLRVDVPPVAPSGEFLLEFTAYSSGGYPVEVHDANKNVVPLKDSLPIVIQYKEQ